MLLHPFDPFKCKKSDKLILGTFPSVLSRQNNFYYGHPQNRFWRVVAELYEMPQPHSINEKKELLIYSGIALWDVIKSCEITGSADASIKNVVPNDVASLLAGSEITKIATNGQKAQLLFLKYITPQTGVIPVCLASTSPANAQVGFNELKDIWGQFLK